ncbi:hypothetical protein RA265_27930, partial [Pseudomonas syringae pv. tagetis]|uniref:hypothetical protein n=1 Tax=Pseudomonas syringae group genomosp. 7 TaxID=251699 RepID=UPI003770289D
FVFLVFFVFFFFFFFVFFLVFFCWLVFCFFCGGGWWVVVCVVGVVGGVVGGLCVWGCWCVLLLVVFVLVWGLFVDLGVVLLFCWGGGGGGFVVFDLGEGVTGEGGRFV